MLIPPGSQSLHSCLRGRQAAHTIMGALLSTTGLTTIYPASTASMCVLPLKTHGQSHFSIAPGPMPPQLGTRLAEVEYHGMVAGVNNALQPLSGFGVISLLMPFLLFDVVVIVALTLFDPLLFLAPWDYTMLELLLPLGFEFGIVFGSFPLMAHFVNRRMAAVQSRISELLDDSSRRYGPRGLHFALKQGVLHNGAGTNMWVEVQVVPIIHVQAPVPVPVPTVCPIVVPAMPPGDAPAPTSPAGTAASGPSSASAAATPSAATAGTASARAASDGAGLSTPPPAPGTHAPTMDGLSSSAAIAGAQAIAAVNGSSLDPRQVEYLRVLQENQLLRQYLAQHQALVQHLLTQQAAHAPPHTSAPRPTSAAAA